MKNDLISIDGRIVPFGDSGINPDTLLSTNFVYHRIHAFAHRPLQARWVADVAGNSFGALYGRRPDLTAELLEKEVGALLKANNYLSGSLLVSLYLFPIGGTAVRMLTCSKQLVYTGYAVNTGLTCTIVPYEYPFAQHMTAVSLAAHTCAADYANRTGFKGVIAENAAGVMTGVGENPLFASAGNAILTSPLEDGAADSAERRLGIAMCEEAGLAVYEHPIIASKLRDYDELFGITPQGIASIRQVEKNLYPHSMAKNLLPYLKKFQ